MLPKGNAFMKSYRIIPHDTENVKDGFYFPAELAAYIDAYADSEKKYAVLVYAIRHGLGIGKHVEQFEALEEIIDKAQGKKPKKKFRKPTAEEVREYCKARRNTVDPEAFVDFYESKGWKVGKEPMKDWKAAVRTWEKRDGAEAKPETAGSFDTEEFFELAMRRTYGNE